MNKLAYSFDLFLILSSHFFLVLFKYVQKVFFSQKNTKGYLNFGL